MSYIVVCFAYRFAYRFAPPHPLAPPPKNVARFNFSHGDHEGHTACLSRLREAASNKGVKVAVLLDTKGPEIRSGFFADGAKVSLVECNTKTLTCR